MDAARWNHNIHHLPVVLAAVPHGAERALDIGCGEGQLTRLLRPLVGHVTGIDLDEPGLRLARGHPGGAGVDYVSGNFLTHPFEPGSFDFLGCVAALHHMDDESALVRMRHLLRPGGTLAIVGLARRRLPADLPMELVGAAVNRLYRVRRTYWETPSPKVWPPPRTFAEIRRLAEATLPGVRYRRHVLWRYSLTWTKPGPLVRT